MQDIDYEELDKAISSLAPPTDTPTVPVAASPTQVNPVINPAPVSPVYAPIAPVPTPQPIVNSIERPATGRFMDVVHPSSDMRSSLTLPQRPVAPAPMPVPEPAPASVPDFTPVQTVYTPPAPVAAPIADTNNWAGLPVPPMANSAPESPFLSEAKVEKRPLGAFSNDIPQPPVVEEPATVSSDFQMPQPIVNEAIPAELDNSLLQVEADSSTHPDSITLSPEASLQPVGATSINQQYDEQPSSTSQENGAIYDASAYHDVITLSLIHI